MTTSQSPAPEQGSPVLLAVGGFDPICASGLARDLFTAAALGARCRAVVTAWTDQGADGVHGVESRSPAAVGASLVHLLHACRGRRVAVKVGMTANPAIAAAVLDALAGHEGPLVVDPVLVASSGGWLYEGRPDGLLPLLRRAVLVTPNAPEAAALTGLPVGSPEEAEAAAQALRRSGIRAVLLKGGHLPGAPTDLLLWEGGIRRLGSPRVPGQTPRGTGCALSTAIAVFLGRGASLDDAVAQARAWLQREIERAFDAGGGERHLPTAPPV